MLSMVEGAVLVVDATEGVMSQTKFVVSKALEQNLKFVVVLNKADRDSARLEGEVDSEIFDLLCAMDASEEQLEFPILYASAKQGWAVRDMADSREGGMEALLDAMTASVPAPNDVAACDEPFAFTVNNIGSDSYLGRLVTGKVHSGRVSIGSKIKLLRRDGEPGIAPTATVGAMFVMRGVERVPVLSAQAGDIVVLAGVPDETGVSDTICDMAVDTALDTVAVAPPTISMVFGANDGPLAGRSGGKFLNSNQIKARLQKEVENNVTIQVKPASHSDQIEVHGRGELQLGILIEELRREGFEMCVSPPQIVGMAGEDGTMLEPYEELIIDVDGDMQGTVIERLQAVRANMLDYKEMGERVRLVFNAASRHLMGLRSKLRNETHGSAVINSIFDRYDKVEPLPQNSEEKGRLISMEQGSTTSYGLSLVEQRGTLFVGPQEEVYEGMVIGEHSRPGDLDVNPCKGKKLTNVRASGTDEMIKLAPPRKHGVEDFISTMTPDEVLEISPNAVRLRKAILNSDERARANKNKRTASKAIAGQKKK